MFTLEQIKTLHANVKSGADFPNYIQGLIKIGVKSYETFVDDGRTIFQGENSFSIKSDAKYQALNISSNSDADQFKKDLKSHQQGNTNYPTFCSDCAKSGIEKWVVDTTKMTCTYYDKKANMILEEQIPSN